MKLTVRQKISENWDINDFKECYQPRTNTVRDEKADLITGSHSILFTWRKRIFQLFILDGVSDVGLREIHTAEPLALDPSAFEIEMTIAKLKSHKSPGIDQIPAEVIKAEGITMS